jgi:putative transposase
MPRQARIDAPGALHHIIARGIENRPIFENDADRDDFVARLSRILTASATPCYAWALIPNHFHLLLQTGETPVSTVMRRLLTGYAGSFNRRHHRCGRLFQNRFKSILCQQDPYLRELVRYIHLNPLRAGIVNTLAELDRYAYCGHCRIMGRIGDGWQAVTYILALFGRQKAAARRHYRAFIKDGIDRGRRPELTGGGLVRSAGGWRALQSRSRTAAHRKGDERILGDSDFVAEVLEKAREKMDQRYQLRSEGYTFDALVASVAEYCELKTEEVCAPSKQPRRARARSLLAYLAAEKLGMKGSVIGRRLNLSQSAVSRAVRRGEILAEESGFSIIDARNA